MESKIFCFKYLNELFNLNPDDTIDELNYFSIVIESEFELNNHCLLITDIPIEITYNSKNNNKFIYLLDEISVRQYFYSQDFESVFDVYKKNFPIRDLNVSFYKLFINYPIGLCEIILVEKDSFEQIEKFSINIFSSKIDEIEFKSLIEYVESKGNSLWANFSLIKHQAENYKESERLDWLLVFCKKFIYELEKKYLGYFYVDKIKTLTNLNEIETYNPNTSISDDSIIWLLNNLDILNPTISYDSHKIVINNRKFYPPDILAHKLYDITDNPENQLVHGFIDELIFFINSINILYCKQIKSITLERFDDIVMYYAFQRKLKEIKYLDYSLKRVKNLFDDEIPVKKSDLNFFNINKIESKEHYFFIYTNLLKWLVNKGANYSLNNNFFKGISRLDELFERACYYQLFDIFIKLGYSPVFENDEENNIAFKTVFINGGKSVKLYYQILPSALTTIKRNTKNLSPDFIIELEDNSYLILDAKYKKLKNIEKYDYSDLTLKYLHGIGPKIGGYLNAKALIVLFPSHELMESYYSKNPFSIDGEYKVYPIIGSLGINFEKQNSLLLKFIQKFLL